jgi:hypothetical protein
VRGETTRCWALVLMSVDRARVVHVYGGFGSAEKARDERDSRGWVPSQAMACSWQLHPTPLGVPPQQLRAVVRLIPNTGIPLRGSGPFGSVSDAQIELNARGYDSITAIVAPYTDITDMIISGRSMVACGEGGTFR